MSINSKSLLASHHPKKHYNSLVYAVYGLKHTFMSERNFRLHLLISLAVVTSGFFYKLSDIEWIIIILTIGFVLVCELINTIIENLMDIISPAYSFEVKAIKDMSAGFVLVSAVVAVLVGIILFTPKIFQ